MGRGFETGSDNERIDELQKRLDDINDSQINSVGGNENISIDSTRGSRNDASGDAGGIRSNEPIAHQITDVDEGGTPTGVFDKINIISSMAVIDHTSSPITLRFIQGTVKDGARIKITPKIGKTINVESGGNILTSSTITITDDDYYELVKYSEAETGVTGGAYKILLTGTGGGGVSFPITPTIDDRGSVGTNQAFVLSNTTGHVLKLTLTASIDITFSGFPSSGTQQEWEVEVTQDGTGGHEVTWPAAVINPPVINPNIGITTIVVFRTNDGGTTIRVGNPVETAPVSGFSGNLSDLVINVNKNWAAQGISNVGALTGVTGIDLDGVSALIQGPQKITFFQAGQQIESIASGLVYSVGNLQSHLFKSLTDNIARFEESASGVFRLDMLDHAIEDVKDISFDVAASFAGSGSVPTIGFDSATSRFLFNLPTGANLFVTNNNVIGSTRMNNGSITTNIVNANDLLQLGVDVTVPTVVGEFRQNGTDVFVFSGGLVQNLSDIGSGDFATKALDNLVSVQINTDLLFNAATHDIGDTTNFVDNLFVGRVRFQNSSLVINRPMITSVSGNSVDLNFPTGSQFNISENGVGKHIISGSSITTPNIIINAGALFFNDATVFPASLGGISRSGSVLGIKFDEVSIRRDTVVAGDIPVLSLTRVDSSPNANDGIAQIDFNIFDSPTETIYARIDTAVTNVLNSANLSIAVFTDGGLISAWSIIGNDNTQNFTILAGGLKPRIQPFVGPMGYFVTSQVIDFSLNVGNSGTLEFPRINDGSPSVNDLNSAGGAFNTSLVVHDISDGTLYVKNSNTQWDAYARTGTVV